MAMFRAMSTRRSRRGYEQLGGGDEATNVEPKLSRARTLPARVLGSLHLSSTNKNTNNIPKAASEQVKKVSKIHPFFSIFETKRKKKATAKPEFSRYLEYLKEGGGPVIYYR